MKTKWDWQTNPASNKGNPPDVSEWSENNDLDLSFDGELYIHGEILSEIRSAAVKTNKKTPLVKFCIFDVAIENYTQNIKPEIDQRVIKKHQEQISSAKDLDIENQLNWADNAKKAQEYLEQQRNS